MRREQSSRGSCTRSGRLLVLLAAVGLAWSGCRRAEPPDEANAESVGTRRMALTNASGHFVPTAETTSPGLRLSSTTFSQTQAFDATAEQLQETKSKGDYMLTQTWTLGGLTGSGAYTFKIVAKQRESTGDSFTFVWSTSTSGPWTTICTVTTADTADTTCRLVATIAAGTTTVYVRVTDSITTSDSVANILDVDYVALIPFDCTTCVPAECEATSECNANETGCTVTYKSSTTVCRAAAGACDAVDYCTGSSATCPGDAKLPTTTVCRAAAGDCDVAEQCDGTTNDCPGDAKQPNTTVCRAAAGDCDAVERCDGTTNDCPGDAKLPTTTVCRAAAGDCDVAENCTGTTDACPADGLVAAGTTCRAAAGDCDVAETCSGTAAACPADRLAPAATVCRAAAGECDVAETCSGTATTCPADGLKASGAACTDDANPCTTDLCDGSGSCAHAAGHAGAVCRAAAGDCDVAETCTGSSATCPADAKRPTTTVCRAAAGDCDVAESCTGTTDACPADAKRPDTTVCRAAVGDCDVAEWCSGASAACPADTLVAAGTVCRAAAGACDVAETCDGVSGVCPADAKVAAGAACTDGQACTLGDACDGAGSCVGAGRDCSSLTAGCKVGQCNPGTGACEAALDPQGDHNECTAGETCIEAIGKWYAPNNVCAVAGSFSADVTSDGVSLTWTLPADPAPAAIEIYRVVGGGAVSKPGDPTHRIYQGLGTSYLDTEAAGGQAISYTAFAIYAGGWSAPAVRVVTPGDSDGDGMPDAWEIAFGLNPYNTGDAGLDPDDDGVTNRQEYLHGTNPLVADSDGDGLSDGQEVALGTDPTNQDTDGDGMADKFEIGLGLDPLNAHDFAIGNYLYSQNYRFGAYVLDSGQTRAGGFASENHQFVVASQQQMTPVGTAGSPTGYAYAGYLYTIEEFIAPNYPPQCDAGLNQSVSLPATVSLSGSASDANGDPVIFSWVFWTKPPLSALTNASIVGATTAAPSFTPDVYGYYGLQLTVTDIQGLTGAPCYVVVTAVNQGQFYVTGPFTSVSENNKFVAVTTSAGGILPLGLASATHQLGAVLADRSPSAADPLVGGAYRFTGRTPDAGGFADGAAGFLATAFALYDVTTNLAPVASAGADQTVPFGGTVTLDGSASHDPDNYPAALTYSWTLWQRPYGSAATITGATSQLATLTPDKAGSYVALLSVSDGEIASVPAPVVITVANTAPVAKAGADQYVMLASPAPTVQLDGSGSFDPEGKSLTYAWRFFRTPDGSAASLSNTSVAQPTFVPDQSGYYRLELVVRDGVLVSAPSFVTVNVSTTAGNLPPVAVVGPAQSLTAVNQTGLDGTGSHDPDWDPVAHPDPDPSGVYRKGLAYDWRFISTPAGSVATITCTTAQSPAWDCPTPVLRFNGTNGTYVVGLKVLDWANPPAVSDAVQVTVTVAGIQDVPPVAVASPPTRMLDFSQTRVASLDGTRSYDPVDAASPLTYVWTIVQQPAGSAPTLTNPTTATPTLGIDREGLYQVHLKVCDQGGQCSCAWQESRDGDATCNRNSLVNIATLSGKMRVAMPAGWPQAGSPGGSGGVMSLFMGDDGVYDKPLVLVPGMTGFAAALGGADAALRELKPVMMSLQRAGYDVWWLEMDPICSGGTPVNLDAGWASGGQDFCRTASCACPWPQVPVDNYNSLNAVVVAQAVAAAKGYGTCAGKSADDPTNPCFVRVLGHSMGSVISRYALAWAQDGTKTTVPYAAGETAPYALDGLRAKPAGTDVWDLGARVFASADGPHQGGNVPQALQALAMAFEANSPDPSASGGPLSNLGFQTSGVDNLFAWAFLKQNGLRNWAIANRDATTADGLMSSLEFLFGEGWPVLAEGVVAGGLVYTVARIFGGAGARAAGTGAFSGYLEGLVAGGDWAIVGAIVEGVVQYALAAVVDYVLVNAGYAAMASSGPYGWVALVICLVLDYFFDFSKIFFDVSTSTKFETLPDSKMELSPVKLTPLLLSPMARELLYERVTSYSTCPTLPMLLQGNPAVNKYPAGFGKEASGRLCGPEWIWVPPVGELGDPDYVPGYSYLDPTRGRYNVTTTTADHDRFYGHLRSLNGGVGYPTNTRNVAITMGSKAPGVATTTPNVLEMYLPYVLSNQEYPASAYDHMPGSGFGTELADALLSFGLHARATMTIDKRFLFWSSSETRLLFDDTARFPTKPLLQGAGWPLVPTQSAADLTRPAGCGADLPCCQLLADTITPHPADDGQRNCCQCTTGFDAVYMPNVSLLHGPTLAVNPCRRGENPEDQFIEGMRQACVAPDQSFELKGVQERMCPHDDTVYLRQSSSGYVCSLVASELATRELATLLGKAMSQLDVRPGCAETSATFVCLSGAATCGASEGTWVWRGGSDRDADGCPRQNGCPAGCESDAADVSWDRSVASGAPLGNHAPVVSAISAQQTFALPDCTADQTTRSYGCSANVTGTARTPVTLSVTATDADGDPLTYTWELVPDAAQGQEVGDLRLTNGAARAPGVMVTTVDRPPQGTYTLRVTVRDNKGGAASRTTSVVVPGDAAPAVSISAPESVPEICEYAATPIDAWRCYADLTVQGSVTDPDGPDQTSIILVKWEDVTERQTSGYRAVTTVANWTDLSPGLVIYASASDAATPDGFPVRLRLTAVDVRGQQASAEASVVICPAAGCQ